MNEKCSTKSSKFIVCCRKFTNFAAVASAVLSGFAGSHWDRCMNRFTDSILPLLFFHVIRQWIPKVSVEKNFLWSIWNHDSNSRAQIFNNLLYLPANLLWLQLYLDGPLLWLNLRFPKIQIQNNQILVWRLTFNKSAQICSIRCTILCGLPINNNNFTNDESPCWFPNSANSWISEEMSFQWDQNKYFLFAEPMFLKNQIKFLFSNLYPWLHLQKNCVANIDKPPW